MNWSPQLNWARLCYWLLLHEMLRSRGPSSALRQALLPAKVLTQEMLSFGLSLPTASL
jgi:hypothetical protein